MRFHAVCAVVLGSSLFALRASSAQVPLNSYGEYRVDAIAGNGTAAQAGAGITIPMGLYVRLGLIGAAGSAWHDGRASFSGRTDAIARFSFDPLRETPIALSLGGGISVPYDKARQPVRPYLTGVIDIAGRKHGRFTPAFQLGLGGGTRVGFILRSSGRTR